MTYTNSVGIDLGMRQSHHHMFHMQWSFSIYVYYLLLLHICSSNMFQKANCITLPVYFKDNENLYDKENYARCQEFSFHCCFKYFLACFVASAECNKY